MSVRKLSLFDQVLHDFDKSLRAMVGTLNHSQREIPAPESTENIKLTTTEKKHSAGLMRVNHTGEVCAQALYLGQAMIAKSPEIKEALQHCAEEEMDHLYWCQQRVYDLNSHVSYLNPIFFLGSFSLGVMAGLAGDKKNLGFLAETEYQVEAHLKNHLQLLPSGDLKSRAIVKQMRADEVEHAKTAESHGADQLSKSFKFVMKSVSKLMTTTTYYV